MTTATPTARLANDRNELYARHRAKGMIPAKAAVAAGYAAGTSTKHLEEDADIMARIASLMEETAHQRAQQRAAAMEAAKVVGQMTGVTRAWVITKLAENAQNAANDGQYKESNAALQLIGQDFGMFSGGSDEETGNTVPQTFDMDKLSGLLTNATDALPIADLTVMEKAREFGEETALMLIEGQVKPKRLDKERTLSTGSETDIAMMPDSMLDQHEDEPLDEELPDEAEDFS